MLWYIDSDNQVTVRGVRDRATGTYLDDATVTAVLFAPDGTEIVSDITFAYVSGSNGDYIGDVPNSADLESGKRYTLRITVASGDLRLSIDLVGVARRKTPEN